MADTVTVDVHEGTLRGKRTSTKSGKTYFSFVGVPYAKPPIGPLRFEVAQPLEPWSGVRDALQEGSDCTQFDLFIKKYHGTEDSLYLNVYSPKLPSDDSEKPQLPVMVWIHGGGFMWGSGSALYYGPKYLMEDNVILVTINYRLGILGFLCLNDLAAPGNVGLKDQVSALRWVQKNITKFGGDPNNVTIFGESAGGASVHYHMLSPMSKGLFSRAIAMSGCAVNSWALQEHPREVAFGLGKSLGFTGDQPKDLVEFFRSIDHMELVKAATEKAVPFEGIQRIIEIPFVATVEIEAEGVERFLPAHPLQLLEEGRYHAVPFLAGLTDKEGLVMHLFADFKSPETIQKLDSGFSQAILPDLRLPKNYKKKDQVISKIRNFFFQDKSLTEDNLDALYDISTDLLLAERIQATLKKMAQLGKAPVYQYLFSYDGKLNFLKFLMKIYSPGASHADELGFLFHAQDNDPDLPPDSADALIRARMVRLWTNFAKSGNPTPEADPLVPVTWKPFTAINRCYLEINKELTMKKDIFKERLKFWEDLYRDL